MAFPNGLRRTFRSIAWSSPAPWMLVVAVLYVAQAASFLARTYHHNVVDDAYISFQYAKNWGLGRGLVFNPGEVVEGYTNFLWVAVLTPLYALTQALQTDFTRAAIALNVVLALLDLGLLYVVAVRLFRNDWIPVAWAVAVCAADGSYVAYAMSGLEIHLLILCLLGAVATWLRQGSYAWLWTGVLLALACMARPDAGLAVAAFGVSGLVGVFVRDPWGPTAPRSRLAARLGLTLLTWLTLYGAYFLWRWSYYDTLLPNTFYLKVGATFEAVERGLVYTHSFFDDRLYLPALALLALVGLRHTTIRWLLFYALLHIAYVIFIGGDFYAGQRFYVPLVPVLALLSGWGLHSARARARSWRATRWLARHGAAAAAVTGLGAGVAGLVLTLLTLRGYERGAYRYEIQAFSEMVDNNIRYTRWLATFVKPGQSMVLGDIGSAGFLADLTVLDVYGVIDPVIARQQGSNFGRGKAGHEKLASRDYVMSRTPTYVKWGWLHGDLRAYGYYIFTDFPRGFRIDGLWIREDLVGGHYLQDTAIRFDAEELRGWTRDGDAFSDAPAFGPTPHQRGVFGRVGPYVNSFKDDVGDQATGRLLSPPIELRGDRMVLVVGGGRDEERLRVSLLIDDERVFSATGHDHEVLGRRVWDISPYTGRTARLEIVDATTGGWGHIMVDEVVQWVFHND